MKKALEAGWSDVVVLCLGEMMTWSGENASRSSIALPQIQEELAKELKKAGKPNRTGIGERTPVGIEPVGTDFGCYIGNLAAGCEWCASNGWNIVWTYQSFR